MHEKENSLIFFGTHYYVLYVEYVVTELCVKTHLIIEMFTYAYLFIEHCVYIQFIIEPCIYA
jgi:hypothetical protein